MYKYVAETGNLKFIDTEIPYANKDSGTVYDHLKRAIDFTLNHMGPHGMPAGLYADWNDCLRLGKNGESSFVALQFYYALDIMQQFAEYKKDGEYLKFLQEKEKEMKDIINKVCWNEDQFIRGYAEDGTVVGKRDDPEARTWLNPQSWAVISGLADQKQRDLAMDTVYNKLNTEYGAILMDPPFHAHAIDGALALCYNAGVKENSGIFSQTQGWLILAESLMGHGNRAFEYYKENCPAYQNDRAEIRHLEPYCFGQFTEGKASPCFGRSHVHWLTGTASTVMVGCVEGILGMRPDFYGLHIAPSIPSDWDGFTVEKDFRGSRLSIEVKNPNHKESGVSKIELNGKEITGDYIPAGELKAENKIVVTL